VQQFCGLIAIVGRPNVGKSTLLNHLIGEKISITSRKPQTTRHRITGILTEDNCQFVFIDTPGLHKHEPRLINRHMNRAASSSLLDVDAIVFVVDAGKWIGDDELVLSKLQNTDVPVYLFINKVDQLETKEALFPTLEAHSKRYAFKEIIPGAALKGINIPELKYELQKVLPQMDFMFPDDYITDRSERFLCAEIIREQLMRALGAEIPYSSSVEIEQFKMLPSGTIEIYALILVERSGQKNIVIGEKGQGLKRIGTEARLNMEKLFGNKILLKLWVKVKEGWADDERALKSLGYTDYDS